MRPSDIHSIQDLVERQVAAGAALTSVFAESEVLGPAQRIVPLDESTLMRSGHVTEPERTQDGVEVAIVFATAYARRQHEELTWRHIDGRQARYLEQPFKAAAPRYPQALARALRAVT